MIMNIERLIDLVMEANDSTNSYYMASAKYKKIHGYGCSLDRADDEARHLRYLYENDEKMREAVWQILYICEFSKEQTARLYAAARAVKEWYERTEWQRCLPADLLDRIERYIFG